RGEPGCLLPAALIDLVVGRERGRPRRRRGRVPQEQQRSHASESAVRPSRVILSITLPPEAASIPARLRSVSWRAMAPHWEDLADTGRALRPDECAELAQAAAAVFDTGGLGRRGSGSFELLWRNDYSEAWLNTWWEARDTGFHDHGGSF